MGLLDAGVVLAGCRIEAIVGRGGMGIVYRARQLDLDRDVALKVIAPEHVEDPATRARFLMEARAAAAVEHPHVLPVFGAGVQDGQAYLVMRYVPGDDLRTLIRVDGPLGVKRAAAIAMDVGGALDAIHRAGYVHRDVKPGNVLIDPTGHVYLSDFGLAKHALASSGPTRSDHWVGTVDFAAPEQIRGEAVDARTDVYALGGVLFFMLTGQVPFQRDNDPAKLWAHLAEDPPRPSALRPDVPARLDEVVLRALAKDPADRQPSAGDLGRAALGDTTSAERTVARGAAAPAGTARVRAQLNGTETLTRRSPVVPVRRRRWAALAALAVVAAAALGVLALAPRRSGDGERPTPTPAPRTPEPSTAPALPVIDKTIKRVGFEPRDVAVAGGDAWVLSEQRGRVDRFDARTGQRDAVQPRIGRGGLSIAADGGSLWVAHPNRGVVQRIDAATGRVTAPIRTPVTPVQVVADRRGLWVAGRALRVDLRPQAPGTPDLLLRYARSGRLLDTIEIPKGIRAMAVGGGFVWVSVWDKKRILQLSADGRRVRRRIRMDHLANDLTFGGGALWASMPELDAVGRIDPRTGRDVTTRVSATPAGLAVAGDRLFVASTTDHKVELLDVATGRRTDESLDVSPNPYAVTAGAGHVWVTSRGNVLTRIDP